MRPSSRKRVARGGGKAPLTDARVRQEERRLNGQPAASVIAGESSDLAVLTAGNAALIASVLQRTFVSPNMCIIAIGCVGVGEIHANIRGPGYFH